MGSKHTGITKWFSNEKGYGFIAINDDGQGKAVEHHEIFVHYSNIISVDRAFRTLARGAEVEFDIITEEGCSKPKAVNVTLLGGEPIPPPIRERNRKKKATKAQKQIQKPPPFHAKLLGDTRAMIQNRGIDLSEKNTVDVAVGEEVRIKLGQGGYTGLAHANGIVAEGTYECDEHGVIFFQWERCLAFRDGAWTQGDPQNLVSSVSLTDSEIGPVEVGETPEKLWGAGKPDPKENFEQHGFLMRRVILTKPSTAVKSE